MARLKEPTVNSKATTSNPGPVRVGETYFRVDGILQKLESHFYERFSLNVGAILEGPAIVLQQDATTVLPPGAIAKIDNSGNMIIAT